MASWWDSSRPTVENFRDTFLRKQCIIFAHLFQAVLLQVPEVTCGMLVFFQFQFQNAMCSYMRAYTWSSVYRCLWTKCNRRKPSPKFQSGYVFLGGVTGNIPFPSINIYEIAHYKRGIRRENMCKRENSLVFKLSYLKYWNSVNGLKGKMLPFVVFSSVLSYTISYIPS